MTGNAKIAIACFALTDTHSEGESDANARERASRDYETDRKWGCKREEMFGMYVASFAPVKDLFTSVCSHCTSPGYGIAAGAFNGDSAPDAQQDTPQVRYTCNRKAQHMHTTTESGVGACYDVDACRPCTIECMDCPNPYMCAECDMHVHTLSPWHRRVVLQGTTNTARVGLGALERWDSVRAEVVAVPFRPIPLRQVCDRCGQYDWLALPLPGTSLIIFISCNGRIDLHHAVYQCQSCEHSLRSTSSAMWTTRYTYPGSPDRAETVFDVSVLETLRVRRMVNPRQAVFSFVAELNITSKKNGFSDGKVSLQLC